MPLNHFLTRLIALCVVPLVVLAVALAILYVRHIQDESQLQAESISRGLMAAIDQNLSARIGGLQMLAQSPLADDIAQREMLYQEARGFYRHFGSHVLLVDADLRPEFNTRLPFGANLPPLPQPKGQSAVQTARRTLKPAVGDTFVGNVAAVPMVAIAVPGVRDHAITQLLLTAIETREFGYMLGQAALPAGWVVTLRDGTGELVARPEGAAGNSGAGGDQALRFAVKSSVSPWSMVLEVSRKAYYAPLVNAIIALGVAITLATLLAVVGGQLAARRLGREVASLAEVPAPAGADGAIAEIRAVRQMLDESFAKRSQAEAERLEAEQRARAATEEAAHKLALSEARLRGIFDSATDAIITADQSQTIVMANPAAASMFRCRLDELIGMPLDRLIPARYREKHRQNLAAFGGSDTSVRRMGGQRPVTGLRADGEEFPADAAISHLTVQSQRLYTVILRDITARNRMEAELNRALREQQQAEAAMRESRDRLRELSSALQTVREEEKTRIARELHDELGQALTALKMDIMAIAAALDPAAHTLRSRTEAMRGLIDTTVASVRRIAADLRPVMLDNLGLVPALEWLARDFVDRTGIQLDLDLADENFAVTGNVATAIYRITQEALTNVARHAGADFVSVELRHGGGQIVVRIVDNGTGIAEGDTRKARSFGLLGMQERAYALGGDLTISRAPGGGTQIEAVIPAGDGVADAGA